DPVFQDSKLFLIQIAYVPAGSVGHGGAQLDHLHSHAKKRNRSDRPRRRYIRMPRRRLLLQIISESCRLDDCNPMTEKWARRDSVRICPMLPLLPRRNRPAETLQPPFIPTRTSKCTSPKDQW